MSTTYPQRLKQLKKLNKQELLRILSITSRIHSMTIKDAKEEIIYAILSDEALLK